MISRIKKCLIRRPVLRHVFCLLFAAAMLSGRAPAVHAAPGKDISAVQYADETDFALLDAEFDEAVMGVDLKWKFPYADSMFGHSADQYDHKLAQSSLGLALSSFRIMRDYDPGDPREKYGVSYLTQAGFTDFESGDYDETPSIHSVASLICRKEMTDEGGPFTLIAVGVSGGGYAMEWLSNFSLGTTVRHNGFSHAAQVVEGRIFVYMAERGITGRLKLWITGYSRAGAVSNIVAADLGEYGPFGKENVFAYTFGCPPTTQEPHTGRHSNIFNIIGKTDVMPQVPPVAWGYRRYGNDMMLPAQETDIDYPERRSRADAVHREVAGIPLINNTEVNRILRSLVEHIVMVCPDNDEYAEHIQETLKHMMEHPDPLSLTADLAKLAGDPGLVNDENREEVNELMDFLLSLIWDVSLRSGSIQKSWDKDIPVSHNLFWEHTPSVYLAWMFSSDDPEDVFTGTHCYKRFVVAGDVTLTLLDDHGRRKTIDSNGVIESDEGCRDVFMARVNNQSIAILPEDADLFLCQTNDGTKPVEIYCVTYDILDPQNKTGYHLIVQGETARVSVLNPWKNGTPPNGLTDEDVTKILSRGMEGVAYGSAAGSLPQSFVDYSEITDTLRSDMGLLSRIERMNVLHLSWMAVLNLVVGIPLILFGTVIVFAVRSFVRRRRKEKESSAADTEMKTDGAEKEASVHNRL